jgi:hypothetical protein
VGCQNQGHLIDQRFRAARKSDPVPPRSDPMSRLVTPLSLQVRFLAPERTAPDQEPTAMLDTHKLERRSRPPPRRESAGHRVGCENSIAPLSCVFAHRGPEGAPILSHDW